jgi:hypothetical protein
MVFKIRGRPAEEVMKCKTARLCPGVAVVSMAEGCVDQCRAATLQQLSFCINVKVVVSTRLRYNQKVMPLSDAMSSHSSQRAVPKWPEERGISKPYLRFCPLDHRLAVGVASIERPVRFVDSLCPI